MASDTQYFDPKDFDLDDPEIQPLIAAAAAKNGYTTADLRALVQKVVDLPDLFGDDPLTKLENAIKFKNQFPGEQLKAMYRQTLVDNPEKADMTFEDFVLDIVCKGADKVEKEIEQDRQNRERLEDLLGDT